ncbi:MAG: hypothetical protein LBB66_10725, partial [Desulfovibrio sp.]|jgi:hypothetical protein|nr:hypothetical protein [Desulfovibrio sp.]
MGGSTRYEIDHDPMKRYVNQSMTKQEISVIHCIGDSHIHLFSNDPTGQYSYQNIESGFMLHWLGPALAHNLCLSESRTQARKKIFNLLTRYLVSDSWLLLSFGEIDCRAHVMQQVMSSLTEQNHKNIINTIKFVVEDIALKYLQILDDIKKLGFSHIMVWNAPPSSFYDTCNNNDFPIYGSFEDRTFATYFFNRFMKKRCYSMDIGFITIEDITNSYIKNKNMSLFADIVHLDESFRFKAIKNIYQFVSCRTPTFADSWYGRVKKYYRMDIVEK